MLASSPGRPGWMMVRSLELDSSSGAEPSSDPPPLHAASSRKTAATGKIPKVLKARVFTFMVLSRYDDYSHRASAVLGKDRAMSSTPVAIRRPLLALLAALALTLTVLPGISSAHNEHQHGAATYEKGCPPALIKKLERAGDNFGQGCDLAGGNLAKLDDSGANAAAGRDRQQQEHGPGRQHPQAGRVRARERAQQRPGVQGPLRLRRQLQRLHGLRHPQAHPAEDRHPGRLPWLPERHLDLAQPADPQRRLQPER